jgi:hypothetical protein
MGPSMSVPGHFRAARLCRTSGGRPGGRRIRRFVTVALFEQRFWSSRSSLAGRKLVKPEGERSGTGYSTMVDSSVYWADTLVLVSNYLGSKGKDIS